MSANAAEVAAERTYVVLATPSAPGDAGVYNLIGRFSAADSDDAIWKAVAGASSPRSTYVAVAERNWTERDIQARQRTLFVIGGREFEREASPVSAPTLGEPITTKEWSGT